jgi:hypothetical protein
MNRASGRGAEAGSEPIHDLIVAKYEVLEQIGASAVGTTYKARHALLETMCSVTVLPAELTDDPRQLALLQAAVRATSRLRHEHIVPVVDFGREAGRYHLVEWFVEGESLEHLLREAGPLGPPGALHIARQLADALAYAHESGVVHGAVTPGSVRVQRGVHPRAMLAGFGTAALAAAGPYSAPERLAGKEVDARSDVFSLGLLLFEMLEGRPFLPGGEDEIRAVVLQGSGPLLPQFSRILPPGVSALVARAIRRSPGERQQSMDEVRRQIVACLQRVGQSSIESKAPVPRDLPVRRHAIIVVDDAVREPSDDVAKEAVEEPPRVAVKVRPSARQPRIPGRVLMAAPRTSRRPMRVVGAILVAVVALALAWPLVRVDGVAPAARGRVPAAPDASVAASRDESARPERPAIAVEEPAPEPAAPEPVVGGAEPQAPAPPVPPAVADEAVQPDAAADETLTVVVLDPARNVAPRIVSQRPREREAISVTEGGTLEFSVRAIDGDPGDQPTYAWFVDGRRVGSRAGWRFVAPPAATATEHTIEVRVTDRAGLEAPRVSWRVAVTPRMSERNVHDWLARLTSAWERKDVATLRLYGIVSDEAEAEAIRKRLRVSIANETIRVEGSHASVGFDRAQIDERGKLIRSRREAYELEKQPNGFIGVRAR